LSSTVEGCVAAACSSGQERAKDGIHCCWPGQAWVSSRSACVGTPSCPSGYTVSGESCKPPFDELLGPWKEIPAGSFTMGSPESEGGRSGDEEQHPVRISRSFALMESEVTQGMWVAVMGSNPSFFKDCGPTCPVEQVSWEDAVAFAQAASSLGGRTYRLPTEAEWEYAARGGQSSVYAGSGSLGAVGWYNGNSGGEPHPVCQKQRNGYGLCDMSGNVREWVSDWYGGYPAGSVTDPAGPSGGSRRVFRGGSWVYDPANARVANRDGSAPGDRYGFLGFRLARSNP
jgi:formylglycine-generating enzyme required for sulfatase activity